MSNLHGQAISDYLVRWSSPGPERVRPSPPKIKLFRILGSIVKAWRDQVETVSTDGLDRLHQRWRLPRRRWRTGPKKGAKTSATFVDFYITSRYDGGRSSPSPTSTEYQKRLVATEQEMLRCPVTT
jgi:hypothetical protein